jgi:hypothetical protein
MESTLSSERVGGRNLDMIPASFSSFSARSDREAAVNLSAASV